VRQRVEGRHRESGWAGYLIVGFLDLPAGKCAGIRILPANRKRLEVKNLQT